MTALPTAQRPELLAAVVDALAHPIAVFEPGPSPLLVMGNAAFDHAADVARVAGLRLVEDIAGRIARLEKAGGTRYSTLIPAQDGPLELDCRLVHDEQRGTWVWWATDVTGTSREREHRDGIAVDARRREVELTRSNEDLERFASIASHDLSEPLRMVASFADLLARRYRGRLDEQADAYIGYILDGASRMRTLIDSLLAFAELRASEHRRQPVDLNAVLEDVRVNVQVAIAESGATIEAANLPVVSADPEAVRQVFQNLVANALKFRGVEAPHITVTSEQRDGEWVLAVADNGIGIADEDRERVFDMFGRLHPRAAYAGSGLGLAMSRRAVELHGGRIWADTAPGGGTVFRFTLPTEST